MGPKPPKGQGLGEVRFKIGFNTRRPRQIRQRAPVYAEPEINSIDPDPEFRNQQVAGSSPEGGSSLKSNTSKARVMRAFEFLSAVCQHAGRGDTSVPPIERTS